MKRGRTGTLPRRLAIDEAGSMERAVTKEVMKNRVPSLLSARLNFSWKKYVIHELHLVSLGAARSISGRGLTVEPKSKRKNRAPIECIT
jgi:hypothetical protein